MRRPRFVGVRFILFGIVIAGVTGAATVGLWNVLMPELFGLHTINFWQALGLLLLSRLLFGRFGGWGSRMRKARFVKGWQSLSQDDRDRFRKAMGHSGRCGGSDLPEQA